MGAGAAILIRERHIVNVLDRAGATSPATAMSAMDLPADMRGVGWRRLRDREIVRETAPGSELYYLDAEVWAAVRRTRHRMLGVMAAVIVVGFILLVVLPRLSP